MRSKTCVGNHLFKLSLFCGCKCVWLETESQVSHTLCRCCTAELCPKSKLFNILYYRLYMKDFTKLGASRTRNSWIHNLILQSDCSMPSDYLMPCYYCRYVSLTVKRIQDNSCTHTLTDAHVHTRDCARARVHTHTNSHTSQLHCNILDVIKRFI